MSRDESAPIPARGATAADPESPWLGLRSFTEETQQYFFGRAAEVQDLYERIVHKPLTVLFGQSGLGKTSLLQAALVPRLREEGYLPIFIRLDHTAGAASLERQMLTAFRGVIHHDLRTIVRQTTDKVSGHGPADHSALEAAVAQSGYEHLVFPRDAESLWLLLHDPQHGLINASGACSVRPVFIFDQFEEIFTLGERPERRQDTLLFRDALACLVENRAPEAVRRRVEIDDDLADRLVYQARPSKVLLTLREDFLHVLERWRRQIPSLMDNRFELRLLNGVQALQAVVEPGKLRGAGRPSIVSEEIGAAIVRFVAGTKEDVPLAEIDAVPPLLSLICSELNARRFDAEGQRREETIQPDQLQGRSEDILQDFYRASFQDVPPALQDLVEDRLLSADGFRESLALDTAENVLEHNGLSATDASAAIATLVDRRLLAVEERGGTRRVELTHDVLTSVARASRDKRLELRAAEQARQEKALAEMKANEQKLRLRRARQRSVHMMILIAACIVALWWALVQWRVAESQRSKYYNEREEALRAASKEKQAVQDAERAESKARASASAATNSLDELRKEQEMRQKALEQSQADTKRAQDAEIRAHKLLVSTFPFRYVAALASNDEVNAEALFTDPTDYEGYGPIHKKTLRVDLWQTIKSYPFRNYTVVGEPTVAEDGKNWNIEFTMQYTLLNKQKLPATGVLRVMMKVNDQLQITRVRETVIQAHKPS